MRAPRPPDDCAGHAQANHTERTDAIDLATGRSRQKILVQMDEPLDGDNREQLIAKHDDAAGDAHHEDPRAHSRADPEVQLEKQLPQPQLLGSIDPAPPRVMRLSTVSVRI